MSHLAVLPILLPLLAGALMLLIERLGIGTQRVFALIAMLLQLLIAGALLQQADSGLVEVYLLGDWPAQLGISVAVDRLSALMVGTTAVLGSLALLYASSGWDQRAPHFHALFQFQLMGLSGAFLTADLFNLFVFFEVLLISSYGLMLSGGRGLRMRAGFHYVVFNVTASTLFLIALGLLYGLLGVLNMHAMSERIGSATPEDLGLIAAAAGLLLVVFGAKAALVPMYLWLPDTYARSPAPVAALFAIMTKLGVYAILRVYTLLWGDQAGALRDWFWDGLWVAGAIGLILAALGGLAAKSLRGLAGYQIVGSAATLFIAIGVDQALSLSAALYYLVHSAFAGAALLLLADLVRRQRQGNGDHFEGLALVHHRWLLGGLYLLITVSMVGLPPLSGFIGKLVLLSSLQGHHAAILWPIILLASLLSLIAMVRAGSLLFWKSHSPPTQIPEPPAGQEWASLLLLIGLGIAMSVFARPILIYAAQTAAQVQSTQPYREAVRQAAPRLRSEMPP